MAEAKIDTSKIKPGDTVTVRGIVSSFHEDGDLRVAIPVRDSNGAVYLCTTYAHPSAVVSHETREFRPGDFVTVKGKSYSFQIIAIDCLRAFLKPHDNSVYAHCVHHLNELERAP